MTRRSGHLPTTLATLLIASAAPAANASDPRTADGVRAVDDAWGLAATRGDAGVVDAVLLPEYRSVGVDGVVTGKAAIVDHARARARATSADAAARVAAWKAAHPTRADVVIVGHMAVLTWVSTRPGSGEPVSSCDVFVYRGGRWRALYSQHTTASV